MELAARQGIFDQQAHPSEWISQRLPCAQRLVEPAPQFPGAHRGGCLARDETGEILAGGAAVTRQAEAAPCRWVEVHIGPRMLCVQPEQAGLEAQVRSLGVAQQRVGCGQALRPFAPTKRPHPFYATPPHTPAATLR